MKRLSRYITYILPALLLAACTDELPVAKSPQQYLLDGDYYFVLESDGEPLSRMTYEGIKHSEFSTGDRIGVFAPQNSDKSQIPNDVFSARDMSVNPPSGPTQVLVPADDEIKKEVPKKEPEYLLYYPYRATQSLEGLSNGTMSHTVAKAQDGKDALVASDLLWCHKLMTDEEKNADYVTIHMHHAMATIVVKVAKDSIDVEAGAVLTDMPLTAKGIKLRDINQEITPERMNYTTDINGDRGNIAMYRLPDDTDEYNYVYRAVVPACQTLAKDKDILTVYLKDKKGEKYEHITYKLARDIELQPGKYYTFNLRSGQKPAIPPVSDDDSWVLDVVDPVTGALVGLLCREYLRFQPDQTTPFTKGSETGTEAVTRDMNGNPTKNINSQAWVFYSMQSDGKTPELSEGVALRFIYDIIYEAGPSGYSTRGVATWPLPHHKNEIGKVQQIILAAIHGHKWVNYNDDEGIYGDNSRDYEEFYMHGAKIIWDGANNVIKDVQLCTSGISDPKGITNLEAELYGHIAIPTDGSAPHVSYTPASDDPTIDMDDNRIGRLIPHTLHDERKGIDGSMVSKDYPLVKIGFNQFWMSKSLRARTLRDGTVLTSYNQVSEPGLTFGNYASDGGGVKEPGYMYTFDVIDDNTSFDPANNYTAEERENLRIPLLYNYVAFENDLLTPQAPESHYDYRAPYVEDMDKVIDYFDYVFAAKMSTQGIWGGINDKSIPNLSESKRQALIEGKWTHSNCDLYCSNISGFNLRPVGFISNLGMEKPGEVASLLLRTRDRNLGVSYAKFNSWNCWSSDEFAGFYPSNTSKYMYPIGMSAREECISRLCAQVRYFMRFKNQQDAAYYGESASNIAKTIGNSLRKSMKSAPESQLPERENNRVIYLDLIRK